MVFFSGKDLDVFFSGTDLLQAGVFSSPVHVCCNTAGSSPWVLKLLGFIPRPQPPNQPLKQGFASLAEVVAGLGGGRGLLVTPESQLASGRGIAREGPKGKGAGAADHKMPGSPVRLHRGDASHRKAKRRCLAQSSVLKKPGIGGVNQPQVCRESSGLWAPLQPGAGKRGKGYHPFRVSEAFGSFLPGCSLSLYKAQSQALAGTTWPKRLTRMEKG